jgi:hypothetical protein
MELTVAERLLLLQILPREGNLTDIRILSTLRTDLSFDETELREWQIRNEPLEDGRIATKWDNAKAKPKAFEFGPRASEIVRAALTATEKAAKLTVESLPLYDRFFAEKVTA